MGMTFGGRPVLSSAHLAKQAKALRFAVEIPSNHFRNTLGVESGTGEILLLKSDLEALDLNTTHDLSFFDGTTKTRSTITTLHVVRAECLSPGAPADLGAAYRVQLADSRRRWPLKVLDAAYNLRVTPTGNWTESTTVAGGGTPYTWAELLGNIWEALDEGACPALPDTPDGTPEGFEFYGRDAATALGEVLNWLNWSLARNPETGVFSFVKPGATQEGLSDLETRLLKYRVDDASPVEPGYGRLPGKLKVLFTVQPTQAYGENPYVSRTVDAPAPARDGEDPELIALVHDDLPAEYQGGTLMNGTDLDARADARAVEFFREKRDGQTHLRRIYAGAQSELLTGNELRAVEFREGVYGLTTEVFRYPRAEPLLSSREQPWRLVEMVMVGDLTPGANGYYPGSVFQYDADLEDHVSLYECWILLAAGDVAEQLYVGKLSGYADGLPVYEIVGNGAGGGSLDVTDGTTTATAITTLNFSNAVTVTESPSGQANVVLVDAAAAVPGIINTSSPQYLGSGSKLTSEGGIGCSKTSMTDSKAMTWHVRTDYAVPTSGGVYEDIFYPMVGAYFHGLYLGAVGSIRYIAGVRVDTSTYPTLGITDFRNCEMESDGIRVVDDDADQHFQLIANTVSAWGFSLGAYLLGGEEVRIEAPEVVDIRTDGWVVFAVNMIPLPAAPAAGEMYFSAEKVWLQNGLEATANIFAEGFDSQRAELATPGSGTLVSITCMNGWVTGGGTNLELSLGGTGATNSTDAFNNLSPLSFKGDIVSHDGTDNVRVPVGTDGWTIIADSGEACGWKWAATTGGYTDEEAQDAVGSILADSATIDFTYTDGIPEITASVIDGSITTAKLASAAVTLAKQANVATGTVFYRKTAGTGSPEVQTLATIKTDLGLSGTNSGDQTITLTGDVTGSGTGSFAATIANGAVTYAKIQNVSATDKILGRSTAGAGVVEEITCTSTARSLLDDTSTSAMRTTLGLPYATQANMESEASACVVEPVNVRFSPGVAKALFYATVSGTTLTLQSSYGVSSLVRNGVGDYTVTFSTAFSTAYYTVSAMCGINTAGTEYCNCHYHTTTAPTTTTCRLHVVGIGTQGALDPKQFSCSFFGDV